MRSLVVDRERCGRGSQIVALFCPLVSVVMDLELNLLVFHYQAVPTNSSSGRVGCQALAGSGRLGEEVKGSQLK